MTTFRSKLKDQAMKFVVNDQEWNTKSDASRFFGNWLRSVTPVYEVSGKTEFGLLFELIKKHPDSLEKIGCGIDRFQIRQNPVFKNSNTFYLIRKDGSETDFSFRVCISGKQKTKWSDFCAAARSAVSDQIIIYKTSRFFEIDPPKCWITGKSLTSDSCHVDHVVTFDELLKSFISLHSIDIDSEIAQSVDGDIVPRFSSSELKDLWRSYHKANAILNLATPEANLMRRPR